MEMDEALQRIGSSKRRKITKTILTVILCILVIAIGSAGYVVMSLYTSLRTLNQGTASDRSSLDLRERVNILAMGVDSRGNGDPGRADSIMLIGLDPVAHHISIVSIPRDSRVEIPGHGYDKINATINSDYFSDGSIQLLERTVEKLLPGVTVNYYAQANFEGFEKVIDALGGVTINVEKPMYYKSADTLINLKPGVQHMDGATALAYARFRHDAIGDFGSWNGEEYGRVVRQKALLKAIVAQTASLRTVWKLPPIIRAVENAVKTDLLPNDLLHIGLTFKNITEEDVATVAFPGIPGDVDGISYVIPDKQALATKVAPLFIPNLAGD